MSVIFSKDIAVLDVTSGSISAIIGCKRADIYKIKAFCDKKHGGFSNGEWFEKEDTYNQSLQALNDVLRTSGSKTKRLFVGVPGEFITIVTKPVRVTLDRERRVVDQDIQYLLKKGDTFDSKKYLKLNASILNCSVDTSDKMYSDVLGMPAERIDAVVSYTLCERVFSDFFDEIALNAGFKDIRYIASAYAESVALFEHGQYLSPYILVDIGYISTSVSLCNANGPYDIKSFSMGGGHIAADIYDIFDVSYDVAESAKELVDLNLNYGKDTVLIGDGDFSLYASEVCEVVRNRLDVLGEVIYDIIKPYASDVPTYSPIFVTGDGISDIRGANKYLASVIGRTAETVTPKLPGFNRPQDSSKISLLIAAGKATAPAFPNILSQIARGGNL